MCNILPDVLIFEDVSYFSALGFKLFCFAGDWLERAHGPAGWHNPQDQPQWPPQWLRPWFLQSWFDNCCTLEGHLITNSYNNSGVYKSLVKDNGVREGEVFALLKDFLLVLQTISTSLKQMAPVEEGEEEDLLVLAFEQLAIAFKLKFDKAFDIKKEYKAKV